MIRMVTKICRDCGQPTDQCRFQIGLRQFGWDKFADSISEEVTIPAWTSSTLSQTP
jgi:hypothetical protein